MFTSYTNRTLIGTMDSPTPVNRNGRLSPITPKRYSEQVLRQLSKDELIDKVLDLETVLNEFQESSKELEQVLEEELQGLEESNDSLRRTVDSQQKTIDESSSKIIALSNELNDLHEVRNIESRDHETEVRTLRQQLVSVEIANDSMESNDRMLQNKLELSKQFNNELLERLAILENDLEREKKTGVEKQLYISNYQNEVRELNKKILDQDKNETFDGDTLVISMREVLSAGPPSTTDQTQGNQQGPMKKSSSLQKLQEHLKILNSTNIANFKSASTATTTNTYVTSSSREKANKTLTPSASSSNLSQNSQRSRSRSSSRSSIRSETSHKSKNSIFSKESGEKLLGKPKNQVELSPIKGSPNPERLVDVKDKPRSKFKLRGLI